jgi:hypothetical protein
MKYVLILITFLFIQNAYTQYDGREYRFQNNRTSKTQIDEAVRLVKHKADSIKASTGFEGNLKINIVYYQENSVSDRKWNCFVVKLTKRIEKIHGEKPKVIISQRTPDNIPVKQSYVAISPIWI